MTEHAETSLIESATLGQDTHLKKRAELEKLATEVIGLDLSFEMCNA